MARRLDDQQVVDTFGAKTHRSLQARDWKGGVCNQDIGQEGFLIGYQTRVDEKHGNFSLNEADVANSLSALWPNDTSHRSMTLVHERTTHAIVGGTSGDDALLPSELDAHRYRCCGNGVAAPVAEWIGRRLKAANENWKED
jgi:hypothetical protein